MLPYDLAFVGRTREQLAAINPRLLPSMAHNCITLAGTMLSIGVLCVQLAVHAVHPGQERVDEGEAGPDREVIPDWRSRLA